jgi:hypothetical protein
MTTLRWSTLVLAAALATHARAAVPTPTITGPITSPGSAFVTPPSGLDLSQFGWVEQEFFAAGTARAYRSALPLGADGNWTATPDGATAPYKTRILVRRPVSPRKFNGTVIVEWLNVSGGLDAAPDWTFLHPFLKREGYAWIGVSAQFVGVEGGSSPLGLNLSLKAVNTARYGSLSHPGDTFSYDMFSQVGQALRSPTVGVLLGGLAPAPRDRDRRIAVRVPHDDLRERVHPDTHVFDAFLIHSRGGGAAALSQSPQPAIGAPTPTFVRGDVDVPVLIFETETDLIGLGYFVARQPDVNNIRTWEVAGTAHDDAVRAERGTERRRHGGDGHDVPAAADVGLRRHPVREADQPGPAALRAERGRPATEPLGARRPRERRPTFPATRDRPRATAPDPPRSVRQRARRHPHAAGRRADRDRLGSGPAARRLLRALRHDDAVGAGDDRIAVSDARRVREGHPHGRAEGRERRLRDPDRRNRDQGRAAGVERRQLFRLQGLEHLRRVLVGLRHAAPSASSRCRRARPTRSSGSRP